MKVKVKVEGLRDFERVLGEIESRATRVNTARRALKAAGEPILRAFQGATVVASGQLLESERMGARLNRRQARLNRADKMPVELHIGTNDPAGVQQEFGNAHQRAAPALRPAWDSHGGEIGLRRIGQSLADEVVKTKARAARKAARKG